MAKKIGMLNYAQLDDKLRIRNLVPGTLVPKEHHQEFRIEFTSYDEFSFRQEAFTSVKDLLKVIEAMANKEAVYWIKVIGLGNTRELEALGSAFGIDNLLLEQVVNITKYSSYRYEGNSIFADLQLIFLEKGIINNDNISLFLKDHILISFSENTIEPFQPLVRRIQESKGIIRQMNSHYLFYSVLDLLADNYLDVMAHLKYDIMNLEERVVNEEGLDIRKIHDIRKRLLHFKLAMGAFEKMALQMEGDSGFKFQSEKGRHIKNLNSHLRELGNEILLQQETVNVLYENYMLNNSNDMNAIMTTLTLFSAIFIPLSFLTGLFGMNFSHIPGLDSPMAFGVFVVACIAMIFGMLTFFKLKKWF